MNQAAENINEIAALVEPVNINGNTMTKEEIKLRAALISAKAQKALRLLESIGAQTRP